MKCTDCTKIDVLATPAMTKTGFAHCNRDQHGQYKSMTFERECDHFIQATEEQKEKRRDGWRMLMNPAPKLKPEGVEE